MTTKRPVLRWHGGKWRLAPWIISHFPDHAMYIEPFGGAGSVLLRKPRVPTEVWNDLDQALVNLFSVLRDPVATKRLQSLCRLTPFARQEFHLSYQPSDDPVENARRMIVRSFFGYGSKSCIDESRNGFRSLRYGSASPACDWRNYWPEIPKIAERMAGVVIESMPALSIIDRYDRPDAIIYCDPPYVHCTRNLSHGRYRNEMSDADHVVLADRLKQCKGTVLVSGYDCELYSGLYAGWRKETRRHFADKSSPRVESLWIKEGRPQ